ncbi:hypothetical protein HGM15179_021630, partial [Zosterops borbonicus]
HAAVAQGEGVPGAGAGGGPGGAALRPPPERGAPQDLLAQQPNRAHRAGRPGEHGAGRVPVLCQRAGRGQSPRLHLPRPLPGPQDHHPEGAAGPAGDA